MSKMKTKTVKIKHSQYHLERETAGEKAEVLPAEATESSEERRGVRAGLSLDFSSSNFCVGPFHCIFVPKLFYIFCVRCFLCFFFTLFLSKSFRGVQIGIW